MVKRRFLDNPKKFKEAKQFEKWVYKEQFDRYRASKCSVVTKDPFESIEKIIVSVVNVFPPGCFSFTEFFL